MPTGKRRTAHLTILHVDLSQKLNRLKTSWKQKENNSPNAQQQPNLLTPMKTKAKDQIMKQQQKPTTKANNQQSNKSKRATPRTNREKFLERRAAKHPEIIAQHAPPMTFYHANRPFESRQASYTEDRQRLEGCHQLFYRQQQKEEKYLIRIQNDVRK